MQINLTPKKILFLSGVLVLLILLPSAFFFFKYRQTFIKTLSSEKTKQEDQKIIQKISKHIFLPQNETPTVATVTDLSKLKDNKFFAQAKLGDIVLLYIKNQKAILYDPKADKIIEVGPVYFPPPTNAPAVSPTSIPAVSSTPSNSLTPSPTTTPAPTLTPTPTKSPKVLHQP